jgi:hypothetical protein
MDKRSHDVYKVKIFITQKLNQSSPLYLKFIFLLQIFSY